jgi:outer membrane receptor protein involved in Fe transport
MTMLSAAPTRFRVHAWIATCLLACTLCRAPLAMANDLADEADLQFNLGADRYEARDFQGALEHFLASNRLVPNKNVVFNIARTYEQLKRAPEAYRYYVIALEGEKEPGARKRIADAVARISPGVAILNVETTPPGATVYLDRKDLGARGTTPRAIGLASGKRRVIVELTGYEPMQSDELEVSIGQQRKLEFKLVRIVGTIRIDGEPGATARLDDELGPIACTLPCIITAPIGRHSLLISRSGYATSEVAVEVIPKQQVQVKAKLAAETGAVVVNADVRDALIEVDGQPVGFTPAVLSVPVGTRRLRVSRSGFRTVDQELIVSKKAQTTVDLQLTSQEEVNAASRTTESVEDAPASVSIVSHDELRAMGYPTIAEAVRGLRGLYLSDDRTYQSVGFRGFSRPGNYGNRVLVLLDGHPLNDNYIWSSYVGFDGRVDLDDIDRIEVVRGAGSVLYGSSAFLGVINLVTRSRALPSFVEGALSTAEYGVGRARATAYLRLGSSAGIWNSISGAYGTGRDLYVPEYVANPADPNAERDASGRVLDGNARGVDTLRAATLSGRFWYKDFTAQWFLTSRNKALRTGEFGTIFNDSRTRLRDTRALIEARFEPRVSEAVQLLTRAHVNLVDFAGLYAFSGNDGPDRELYRSVWAGVEQRAIFTPNTNVRLTLGGEVVRHLQVRLKAFNDVQTYQSDSAGTPELNVPFTSVAVYANGDVNLSKALKLSAGTRFDYFSNVDAFDAVASLNPRIALIVKPYPGGNLKVIAGKAFKTPAVYELHYVSTTQEKSVGLRPEQVYSGEIEYSHRFSPTFIGTLAGYTNYISGIIELGKAPNPSGGEPLDIYRNASADVLIVGAETELRREWRQGWMASLSYSFQRARYIDAPALRRVPNSPEQLASLKAAAPIIGRSLTLMTRLSFEGIRHDGAVNVSDSTGGPAPSQGTTEPGVVWDFVLAGDAEKLGVHYNVGLYNVADTKYDTVPSTESRQRTVLQNGRTVLATVSAKF